MSERTVGDARDHAAYYNSLSDEIRKTAIVQGTEILVGDIMLLGAEVERLRAEVEDLEYYKQIHKEKE